MLRSANMHLSTFPGQTSYHGLSKLNTDAQMLDKIYVSWLVDHTTL